MPSEEACVDVVIAESARFFVLCVAFFLNFAFLLLFLIFFFCGSCCLVDCCCCFLDFCVISLIFFLFCTFVLICFCFGDVL